MKEARIKLFNLIREDDENTLSGTVFDVIIIGFILLNVIFILIDTFHPTGWLYRLSKIIEIVSAIIFTVEYIFRIWTAPLMFPDKKPIVAYVKYFFSFMALIDLLSILPVFIPIFFNINLPVFRSIRILRLLRVFKIARYTDGFLTIVYVLKKKAHQLVSSMIILFVMLLIASVIMFEIEHTVQPDKFDNALSAFWWAVSTVTTLGYGDLYPITPIGKFVGIAIILIGIGLVAVPTGIISAGFVEAVEWQEKKGVKKDSRKKGEITCANDDFKWQEGMEYCPYCGERLDKG